MLEVSNLTLSPDEINEIYAFILSCRRNASHSLLGLINTDTTRIERVDFWGIPHICISGFCASFDDVRAYVALNSTQQLPVAIHDTPHYHLAVKILQSHSFDSLLNTSEALTYMQYLNHQYGWDKSQQTTRLNQFIRLVNSIQLDFNSNKLAPWRGKIVCLYNPGFLGIQDGFHRAAIIAALRSKVMPYYLYYAKALQSHIC
tara:strand:- start:2856 stop:3461 length:606 start_codon:yes stop_codon:yes gene_type:complete